MAYAERVRVTSAHAYLPRAAEHTVLHGLVREHLAVVIRILRHLGLPTELPDLYPARPPPVSDGTLALDFPD